MPPNILFAPFGSEGDVNPLLWLARGMAEHGYHPIFLLTPNYGHLADRQGFEWHPIGSEKDFMKFARDPRIWSKRRGPEFVLRGMLESLPLYTDTMQNLGRPIRLAVTSTFGLPAATIAEGMHIPQLTLHLQPVCYRSVFDCPYFSPDLRWLINSPRWIKKIFFLSTDAFLWHFAQKPLNRFRKKLNLPIHKNFYYDSIHRGHACAALFPDWYASVQPDWPQNTCQFSFPLDLSRNPLPSDLQSWLEAGPPPILWTHGSANFHVSHFQSLAITASQNLRKRCLLISLSHPLSLPDANTFHIPHVRFEDVLPHCAAIVHHGGIGTTAKAIVAGIPQLIIPRSHDQPDNANRITHLNLGTSLSYQNLTSSSLEASLQSLLSSSKIQTHCQKFQHHLLSTNPLPDLIDWALNP